MQIAMRHARTHQTKNCADLCEFWVFRSYRVFCFFVFGSIDVDSFLSTFLGRDLCSIYIFSLSLVVCCAMSVFFLRVGFNVPKIHWELLDQFVRSLWSLCFLVCFVFIFFHLFSVSTNFRSHAMAKRRAAAPSRVKENDGRKQQQRNLRWNGGTGARERESEREERKE